MRYTLEVAGSGCFSFGRRRAAGERGFRSGWRGLLLLLALSALYGGVSYGSNARPDVRDGDLIFQTSRSAQSLAIQHATGSPYSHMGLIFFRDGKPYVLEAIATVRFTPLDQWIARGAGHHFVIKRLQSASTLLKPAAVAKLRAAARRFEGRPYDLVFDWSDRQIYCSELAWKAYDRGLGIQIGSLQRVRDFNLSDPIVRSKMRERYGDKIPLDEPVISPVAMFRSALLRTVAQQ